jgi:hypothetical protein
MRITTDMQICVVPAVTLRMFFRAAIARQWDAEWLQSVLHLPSDAAVHDVIACLVQEGYAVPATERGSGGKMDNWHNTPKGNALANATAANPIKRATADRLAEELRLRIEEVKTGDYAFYVEKAVLFGSYLGNRATLGDIDVALQLVPKFPTDRDAHLGLLHRRIDLAYSEGRRFASYLEELFWPN